MGRYDIYWVKFDFEDDPGNFKIRPALLLGGNEALELGAKITKHSPRTSKDYILKDWDIEGLKIPSTVRLDKIQKVAPLIKIGHLTQQDINGVEEILNK